MAARGQVSRARRKPTMDAIHIKQCEVKDCDNQATHFSSCGVVPYKGIISIKTTSLCTEHANRTEGTILVV